MPQTEHDLDVVGLADAGNRAIDLARRLRPDVVVTELIRTIRSAARGQVRLSPRATARLIHEVRRRWTTSR